MFVIAIVFRKLQTLKTLVRTLSEKRRFTTRFDSPHVKASQILAKCPWERFYHVFSSLSLKLIWKMSPLVLGGMVGLSGNTLTADGKYFVQNCQNFPRPIEKQWSEKRKSFSEFFVPFLVSTSNFKHFEEKDDCHS